MGTSDTNVLDGLKVMVIDDSKTIRRTAETLLKKSGCEVVTATDGFEALSKILEHRPNIIFVDIMMPRLDGYQTCALIKNNRADKAFISAAGIDENLGLTTYFYFEADIKRAIIGSAKQIILVADASKFGKISITYFASLNEVQTIITDDNLSDNYREIAQNLGIELVIADS